MKKQVICKSKLQKIFASTIWYAPAPRSTSGSIILGILMVLIKMWQKREKRNVQNENNGQHACKIFH
jgi:hypothetical protein